MRLGLLLGDLWFICFAMLLVISVSRWFFDPPPTGELGRNTQFLKRIGASIIWPIMLFSAGGRQKLVNILKGE